MVEEDVGRVCLAWTHVVSEEMNCALKQNCDIPLLGMLNSHFLKDTFR